MKGIVLAGGLGTRLDPLTRITNKHLLPIYDRPMIYYPIQTLVNAGISEILIVTGGNWAGDFLRLLGNGKQFGLKHLDYTYQEGERGIADALAQGEHFAEGGLTTVILGDNIIEGDIRPVVDDFTNQGHGAKILIKEVEHPERFGVAQFDDNKLVRIIEKPSAPPSRYAVIGIYMYDSDVFDIIKGLEPSPRGQLEISDVNNAYLERESMTYATFDGWWTDAGTFESLFRANKHMAQKQIAAESAST